MAMHSSAECSILIRRRETIHDPSLLQPSTEGHTNVNKGERTAGVHWITGASSGIGRSLALELARRGATVAVTARREELLSALSQEASTMSGKIVPYPGDVTNLESLKEIIGQIEHQLGPIERAILNAGRAGAEPVDGFSSARYQRCFEINLFGITNALEVLLPGMISRQRGEIYFMGSLSAYRGLPGMTPYAASKAALKSTAESLAPILRPTGVKLRIINPGFIRTPMTADNQFPMPFLMNVETAAKRIVGAFDRDTFEIAFPKPMAFAVKCLRLLPYPAYMALMRRMARRRKL